MGHCLKLAALTLCCGLAALPLHAEEATPPAGETYAVIVKPDLVALEVLLQSQLAQNVINELGEPDLSKRFAALKDRIVDRYVDPARMVPVETVKAWHAELIRRDWWFEQDSDRLLQAFKDLGGPETGEIMLLILSRSAHDVLKNLDLERANSKSVFDTADFAEIVRFFLDDGLLSIAQARGWFEQIRTDEDSPLSRKQAAEVSLSSAWAEYEHGSLEHARDYAARALGGSGSVMVELEARWILMEASRKDGSYELSRLHAADTLSFMATLPSSVRHSRAGLHHEYHALYLNAVGGYMLEVPHRETKHSLEAALKVHDRLGAIEPAGALYFQSDRARAKRFAGYIETRLGNFLQAHTAYEESFALALEATRRGPLNSDSMDELVLVIDDWLRLLHNHTKPEFAVSHHLKILAGIQSVWSEHRTSAQARKVFAQTYLQLGYFAASDGEYDLARSYFSQAIYWSGEAYAQDPDLTDALRIRCVVLRHLGQLHAFKNQQPESTNHFDTAERCAQDLIEKDPDGGFEGLLQSIKDRRAELDKTNAETGR